MISEEGYPDKALPGDIAQGFSLVGHAPSSSGVLPSKIEPATLAVSELEERREAPRFSTVSSGDPQSRQKLRKVGWWGHCHGMSFQVHRTSHQLCQNGFL